MPARHAPPAAVLTLLLLGLGTRETAAQIMVGIGPAFPTGDFNSQSNAETGYMASGRIGFSLLALAAQFEVTYSHFQVADLQNVGTRPVSRLAVGGNLALHLIRVGGVRPYVLAGGSFGRREIGEDTDLDTSWRLGLHVGGGVDLAFGPLKPFVEVRYVDVDAPGPLRDTSVPILVGLRLF